MSPNLGGIPPAKRQRLSPNPPSPYPSPYPQSPYANSPPPQYMSRPGTPSMAHPQPSFSQPQPSFNQPQPYPQQHNMEQRPVHGSMPPPKVPYSKTQDTSELEKANPRDMDVNTISDILTGSGIDLRAEEENLLGNRYGNSFNSQTSSTLSPHGSFNQWSQASGHGAFQGNGPLSQAVSQEQQEEELKQKHIRAVRALAEHSQSPLSDPFLQANVVRRKVAERAYEHGISVNLEGLFDKIPQTPQNVTRTTIQGANGESVQRLEADSLLNREASFVEVLTLLTLAAEERIRTVLEDSLALSRGRRNTSHGVVPPSLVDLAATNGDVTATTAVPTNLSKTAWEAAPDSAISPMTVPPMKQLSAGRLPTPPTEAPPTPQPTISFPNHVALALKRRAAQDRKWEEERIAKRQKRLRASISTPADAAAAIPTISIPEKMTKKERDRIAKIGQTEEVLHRKANETASMALGKKKKYSWMTGGGGGGGGGGLGGGLGGGSGASTPRLNTAVGGAAGSASGTATPAQQPGPSIDRGLIARKRTFGDAIELGAIGKGIQVRDVIHVLELDGREKKTLVQILARLKNTENENENEGAPGSASARERTSRPSMSMSTSFSAGSR
ncbi:transcription initiation factor TFIID component TAF4 family-domain-containing protein [Clohesyomyces aquaticus]|uniref:Transcription initiation factor TFIID subunit 4 n=1 Tax=Clohesyomyces aquaticus TaxID=1231657 RepID=A0A1Y1ZT68_9PLEO|nr:transcription initiation factor TFIID component TAF4 family-domain-containing protein [Clohesyomyces aquaticus]